MVNEQKIMDESQKTKKNKNKKKKDKLEKKKSRKKEKKEYLEKLREEELKKIFESYGIQNIKENTSNIINLKEKKKEIIVEEKF